MIPDRNFKSRMRLQKVLMHFLLRKSITKKFQSFLFQNGLRPIKNKSKISGISHDYFPLNMRT